MYMQDYSPWYKRKVNPDEQIGGWASFGYYQRPDEVYLKVCIEDMVGIWVAFFKGNPVATKERIVLFNPENHGAWKLSKNQDIDYIVAKFLLGA